MKVKNVYDERYGELWLYTDLIGWTATLGRDCEESWRYLSSLADRLPWLSSVFGSAQEFRISLSAYYMALNIQELAWRVAHSSETNLAEHNRIDLFVPISFVSETSEIRDRAFSLLIRDRTSVEKLWTDLGIAREDIEQVWPNWLRVCSDWVRNVYRLRVSSGMPHEKLFELL
jgi:hypothetical protein